MADKVNSAGKIKKRKQKTVSGAVTVFLTCMLMLFLTFALACVKGARHYAIRTEAECIADMGLDSVFAEYNRELLERYDLFFIDTTYGLEEASYHFTEEHLKDYLEANLHPEKDMLLWNSRDFLGMELEEAAILQAALATDDHGQEVKYQAVTYIQDMVGLEFLEELQAHYRTVKDYDMDVRDVEAEADEVQRQIDRMPLPEEQLEDGSFVEAEIDNPAQDVNASKFKGILYLVTERDTVISDRTVNTANYVSHRSCNTGTGAESRETSVSAWDELLFGEYLLNKCSYYGAEQSEGELLYELEYILAGKSSDMENLKWVANRLILLREVANVSYLYTDKKKLEEVDLMAWGLAIVALKPDMQPLIKQSIIFAWAYAESVQDVKLLLSGGNVPLLKTADTWHLSLAHMLDYQNHLEQSGEGDGLDYAMYLRLLLLMEKPDIKTERFMDIVEMNLRKTEGNLYFRMDGCMDSITASIRISGADENVCHIIKKYSYLNR